MRIAPITFSWPTLPSIQTVSGVVSHLLPFAICGYYFWRWKTASSQSGLPDNVKVIKTKILLKKNLQEKKHLFTNRYLAYLRAAKIPSIELTQLANEIWNMNLSPQPKTIIGCLLDSAEQALKSSTKANAVFQYMLLSQHYSNIFGIGKKTWECLAQATTHVTRLESQVEQIKVLLTIAGVYRRFHRNEEEQQCVQSAERIATLLTKNNEQLDANIAIANFTKSSKQFAAAIAEVKKIENPVIQSQKYRALLTNLPLDDAKRLAESFYNKIEEQGLLFDSANELVNWASCFRRRNEKSWH